ncbi:MAG: hypothetical protein ABSB58_06965 [Gemmatimonadales bacterium]|jgi:hypothetical protein
MTWKTARAPLLLLALTACYKAPTDAWQPVRVTVHNLLVDSVTVVAGGVTYGTFASGWTSLVFPPDATALTWTPTVPLYSDSTPVPTDLTAVTASFAAAYDTVVISNVVGGQAYVTPLLYNLTGVTVDVAIVDNGAARLCVELGPTHFRLAYYRLTPTVAIRVYRSGTTCTGTFLAISHATLAAYQAGSGLALVNVNTAP